MTLSLEYALSVNHVGSTPTPGDDMAVAACTDVGYRSGKFEGHSRVATDVIKMLALMRAPYRMKERIEATLSHVTKNKKCR